MAQPMEFEIAERLGIEVTPDRNEVVFRNAGCLLLTDEDVYHTVRNLSADHLENVKKALKGDETFVVLFNPELEIALGKQDQELMDYIGKRCLCFINRSKTYYIEEEDGNDHRWITRGLVSNPLTRGELATMLKNRIAAQRLSR